MKRYLYLILLPLLIGCGRSAPIPPQQTEDERPTPKPEFPTTRWTFTKPQLTTWTWTLNDRTYKVANLGWDEETEEAWTIYDVTRIDDGSKRRFFVRKLIRKAGAELKDVQLVLGHPTEGEEYFKKIQPVVVWNIKPTRTLFTKWTESLIETHLNKNYKHRCLKAQQGRDFSDDGNLLLRPSVLFHIDRITAAVRSSFEFDRNSLTLVGLATDLTPELFSPPYFPFMEEKLSIYLPMNRETLKAVNPRFYDKEARFQKACEGAYLRLGKNTEDKLDEKTDDDASRIIDRYPLPKVIYTGGTIKLNTLFVEKEDEE